MTSRRPKNMLVRRPAAVALLLAVLLLAGACSDDGPQGDAGGGSGTSTGRTEAGGDATPPPEGGPETTGNTPPEVTLGQDSGSPPEAVVRIEGDPKTSFTGLCSVGGERSVLSGRVPERFEFDLDGRRLECRIEKRDGNRGDLKVVLIVGDTTRSVQQTNAPGGVVSLSYGGG